MSTLFKNTFFQGVSRAATVTTTVVASIIIARIFGTEGFGEFTLIVTYIGFFYLLLDFGLNAVFIREYGDEKHFSELLTSRLVASIAFIIIANLLFHLFPYSGNRSSVLIFSFSLVPQAILFSTTAIFQKRLRYDLFMVCSIIGASVTLVGMVVAANNQSFIGVIYAYVFGSVVAALCSLVFAGVTITFLHLNKEVAKRLVYKSLPLAVMLLLNLVYFRVDILLLSFMQSSGDVGIYGMAYKVFDVLIALPLFLSNALYPSLITQQGKSVKQHVLLYLIISLTLLIVFWFVAPLLSFIREEFSQSIIPFKILLLSLPVFFLTSILQWILIARRQELYLVWVYFSCGVVNIVLNILFIPHYSYIASSVITGVTETLVFTFLLLKFFSVQKNTRNKI